MKRGLVLLIFVAVCGISLVPACGGRNIAGRVIRVPLARDDSKLYGAGQVFSFEREEIDTFLEKRPVRLPDPLPAGVRLVVCQAGPVYGLFEKTPGREAARLTLDANMNFDLTDDAAVELPKIEQWNEGSIVWIARSTQGPPPRTEQLPYRVGYQLDKGRDGRLHDTLFIAPNYRYLGGFRLNGRDYGVELNDGDLLGRFIREKQVNVNVRVGPKSDMESWRAVSSHRLYELIAIADALYEIRAIAEDGSWIEFVPSNLPTTALGRLAPDFEITDTAGRRFRLGDYRGKLLVLDFWYVWCKPCIAKFPDIKKMVERFADRPFAAIGINIDDAARVGQAKQIIVEHGLSWRQVVEGKGEFIPAYQVYGRLPEHPMSFPIYVAIDERGYTRYSTNDFRKMELFLEAHFGDPGGPEATLFVPCGFDPSESGSARPVIRVDFTGPKVRSLCDSGGLKLPEGLPAGARVGLLPNGTALVIRAGASPGTLRLILDADRDFDLSEEDGYDLPVLAEPRQDVSKMVEVGLRVPFQSGGIAFLSLPFYAAPAADPAAPPDVFCLGTVRGYAGKFFVGKTQYSLQIIDADGDALVTEADTEAQGFLRLSAKRGQDWVPVHRGTTGIPVGGSLFRLRHVSDDGNLVVLEKQE